MGSVMRGLLLLILGVGVAGFGLCSLCGGVMGTSFLTESGASSRDMAWLAYGLSLVGGLLAWGCWRGFMAVRSRTTAAPSAQPPAEPPAP